MKTPARMLIVLALCGMCFIIAVAFRVFLPYYQGQQDRPKQLESQGEVRAIMQAINRFVEESPEHAFPSKLDEVKPFITIAGTNLDVVFEKFVYLRPPHRTPKDGALNGVVLLEKLGHYKYREGGYYGIAGDNIPGWYSLSNYQRFVEKTGLTIEQFSEHRN